MFPKGFVSSLCGVVCAIASVALGAQTSTPEITFEVATVKPVLIDATHHFDPGHFWVHVSEGHASYWSMSPASLIAYAYDVDSVRVTGTEWTKMQLYDVEAKIPDGADKKDQRKMLKALLKDRFKLSFRIEQKPTDVYALVVSKHSEKLKPSLPDPVNSKTDPPQADNTDTQPSASQQRITRNADGSSTIDLGERGKLISTFDKETAVIHTERTKMTMEELASSVRVCLDGGQHEVVDETGLKGPYQVAYDCPLRRYQRASDSAETTVPVPSAPQGAVLQQSLDALGLKLEKRKVMKEVYVIDHIERPTEN